MTDQSSYRAALEPWAKKAERERSTVDHVRWVGGHAEVQLRSKECNNG